MATVATSVATTAATTGNRGLLVTNQRQADDREEHRDAQN
jgi:hypothetical protein